MAINNSLVQQKKEQPAFSAVINSVPYQRMINNTLKDPSVANRFIASIISAVATTPALQECTPKTIVSGALLGESLKLSPSPQLGHFYLVPFKDTKAGVTNAQFILGVKGYKTLALRSGVYKRINAMEVKEGELIKYNPFDDEIEFRYIDDEEVRESLPTIGYYAMFEMHNGFKKVLYWNKKKMINHADKYSAAFSKEAKGGKFPKVSFADYEAGNYNSKDAWLYSSYWYQNFDEMGVKTMLRQILSKWGLLSTDMEKAFSADGGVVNDNGTVDYVDFKEEVPSDAPVVETTASEVAVEEEIQTPATDDFEALMEG